METYALDFHGTFRTLSSFKPSLLRKSYTIADSATAPPAEGATQLPPLENFIASLLSLTPEPGRLDHGKATAEWLKWLEKYAERIESERAEWTTDEYVDMDAARAAAARGANPRFVLRQWVLEEVISKVEKDADSGKRVLAKVMHVGSSSL